LDSFPGSQERGISPYYPNYRQFRQATGIPNPAGTLLFLEEHPDSINDGVYLLNPLPASSWMDVPAAHHEDAANFAFADGHAETRRWLTNTSIPPVRFMYTSPPLRGQAMNDYRWVAERLTVPVSALAVSRSAGAAAGLRLAWSQLQTPHVLQRTLDVGGGHWTPVTSPPAQSVGQWEVEVAPDEARGFFRLGPP
jgi:prepilin-type processing-associated H-X9-DG protein